jgi:hypothetical protein
VASMPEGPPPPPPPMEPPLPPESPVPPPPPSVEPPVPPLPPEPLPPLVPEPPLPPEEPPEEPPVLPVLPPVEPPEEPALVSPEESPELPLEAPAELPPEDPPVLAPPELPPEAGGEDDPPESERRDATRAGWFPSLWPRPARDAGLGLRCWGWGFSLVAGCSGRVGAVALSCGSARGFESVPLRVSKVSGEDIPPDSIHPTSRPARMLSTIAEPIVGMPTLDPGGLVLYMRVSLVWVSIPRQVNLGRDLEGLRGGSSAGSTGGAGGRASLDSVGMITQPTAPGRSWHYWKRPRGLTEPR